MRMTNKAIRREQHQTPMVDDLIHTLNGATVFLHTRPESQLSLESRYITTFVTHKGLRHYVRLNFGTNSASEIFQNIISEQIRDIPGSLNISDDVIVFGKSQADHDKALKAVFQKFAEVNLTLNKSKCAFNKSSLSFFGFVFSKDGISPDPRKVEAIHSMDRPSSVHEIRSFLGMATNCAKFIPSFSDISHSLQELTKKDVTFKWTPQHQSSFEEIKQMLTSEAIMSYFDPQKETDLTTDASPVGQSAILSQCTPGQNDRKDHSRTSNNGTRRQRKKLWQLCGPLRDFTFICTGNSSTFSLIPSPNHQPELNDGICDCKDMISKWCTPRVIEIPLIFSHDTPALLSQGERRKWQKTMSTSFHLMQCLEP